MAKKNTLAQTTTFKNNLDLLNANKPKNTYGILTYDPVISSTPQYKKMAVVTSSGSSTKTPVTLKLGDYSYNDIYNSLYSSYGGGKSSGGYNVKKTDISGVLEALEKEAQSLRDVASSTYKQNKKSAQSAYDLAAKNAQNALNASLDLAQNAYDTSSKNASSTLKALLEQAQSVYDTSSNTAKKSYETTRSDLLTSIKRFQEQNARDVQQQKQDYLNEQAALEAARESVNRQNRISSSARGLGGSGLQQLAQMQNLLNQGQQISKLAGENQEIREALSRALVEAEEDNAADMAKNQQAYDTALEKAASLLNSTRTQAQTDYDKTLRQAQTALSNAKRQARTEYDIDIDTAAATLNDLLSNADTDYNNTLAKIASNLRTQREDRISANEAAYTNAVNQARAQAAQIAASNKAAAASAKQEARSLVNLLNSTQTQYEKELKALDSMSKKDLKDLAEETYGLSRNATKRQIANAINDKYQNFMTSVDPDDLGYATRFGLSKGNINTYTNNLNSLLKYYGY